MTASFFIQSVTLQRLLRYESIGLQHQSLRALLHLINFRINGHISMTFCLDSFKSFLLCAFTISRHNNTNNVSDSQTSTTCHRILNFRDTTELR